MRFTWKTNDHIDANAGMWHGGFYFVDAVFIQFAKVSPLHQLQDLI